jgi:transposase-like protein
VARGMSHKGGFTHAASHKGVEILKKKRKKRCITKICTRHKEEDAMKSIPDYRITIAGFINGYEF